MGLARNFLLRASRSAWLARQMRDRAFVRRAVRRFMPGEDLASALAAAGELDREKVGSVLTELGEQVSNPGEAQAVRDHYLDVLAQIKDRGLDAHVSIKLTHLGLDIDRETCFRHVAVLASRSAEIGTRIWIDMEESRYVDVTLDLFRRAQAGRPNVGVCLQAYLRRTPADLESLLPLKPAIRLVKGAYNEPADTAFPSKRDVDAQYFRLAGRLLEQVADGALPVFGTHDMRLIRRIGEQAAGIGLDPASYQLHMLFGIGTGDQRALARKGHAVRVLISYGTAWFAWYMRRLAERPANVWFVLRNLV
ncbi:MAG: proline dehydrogenase family protein [Gemmatimonadales bacterium]